ncbi:hypothetical protein A2U01_0052043, partial [Trifolium medium]|nr:hypothetical protein [Trifolium medium]
MGMGAIHQKLNATLTSLHKWGSKRFGVIPKRIKIIQDELHTLNNMNGPQRLVDNIRSKGAELDDLLECEEMWW